MSLVRPAKRARHQWESEIAQDGHAGTSVDTPRFGDHQQLAKLKGALGDRKTTAGVLKRLSWGLFGGKKREDSGNDDGASSDEDDEGNSCEEEEGDENAESSNVTAKEGSPSNATKSDRASSSVEPIHLAVEDIDSSTGQPIFTYLPDFASSHWGAKVIFSSDEFFGRAENLLQSVAKPQAGSRFHSEQHGGGTGDEFTSTDGATTCSSAEGCHGGVANMALGPFGVLSDGWQTRRRRHPGHDWTVIQLAEPTCIQGITVDMSHVTQMPPSISVEGGSFQDLGDEIRALVDAQFPELLEPHEGGGPLSTYMNVGYPQAAVDAVYKFLDGKKWTEIVPLTRIRSHDCNEIHFAISATRDDKKMTHVRLNLFPDGGVHRFRAYGEAPATSAFLKLAAEDQPTKTVNVLNPRYGGGVLWASSCRDFGMGNLVAESEPKSALDGWRSIQQPRRPPILFDDADGVPQFTGEEFVVFKCATRCIPKLLRVDTEFFLGDSPASIEVEVIDLPEIVKLKWLQQMEFFKANGGSSLKWQTLIPKLELMPHAKHELHLVQSNRPDTSIGREENTDPRSCGVAPSLMLALSCPTIRKEILVDFDAIKAMTHMKINLIPDGGLSRVLLMAQVCDVLVADLSAVGSRGCTGNTFVTGTFRSASGAGGTGSSGLAATGGAAGGGVPGMIAGVASGRNRTAIRRRSAALLLQSSLQNMQER